MEAAHDSALETVRAYFGHRNEIWVSGETDKLLQYLPEVRVGDKHKVTASILCKRRAMSARKIPLLRAHTKIRVTPSEDKTSFRKSKADATFVIREHVTWVYQEAGDYRVEGRIILHRQRWVRGGKEWRLASDWESDELQIAPSSMNVIVRGEDDLRSPQASPANTTIRREYDRLRAFRYAELWWDAANPTFPTLREDCTNFVSQCLHAGGIPMKRRASRAEGWWVEPGTTAEGEKWSYSWATTEALRRYVHQHLGGKSVQTSKDLRIGDLVFYDWEGTGRVHHATIVTDFDESGDALVNAHTDASSHRHYRYLDSRAWTPETRYDMVHLPDKWG